MFNRRLHMLFPERRQAASAVQELLDIGLRERQMHTVAREDIDLSGLPEATVHQRTDMAARIETWLWNINLLVFFIAVFVAVAAVASGQWLWLISCLGVMAACFGAGNYFASHVPHVHMRDFQAAMGNGEVLLLVDVGRWRVHAVESRIQKHHPEMELGGVSWTVDMLGI